MNNILTSLLLLIQALGLVVSALPYDERDGRPQTTAIDQEDSVPPPDAMLAVRNPAGTSYLDPANGCISVGVYVPDGDLAKIDGPGERGYKNSPRLGGFCRRDDGIYQCSSIDLGKCIANRRGKMSWALDGNFQSSCQSCQFVNGNKELLCFCYKDEGKAHITYVYLDEYITNVNGRLSCHGYESELESCVPFNILTN